MHANSFERTISFTPFASDWPSIYDDDRLPEPPTFTNLYAWDGKSPQAYRVEAKPVEKPDPQAYEERLKQLPQNSIEAEVPRVVGLPPDTSMKGGRAGNRPAWRGGSTEAYVEARSCVS